MKVVLKIVDSADVVGDVAEDLVSREEVVELQKISNDPATVGLSIMTPDGAIVQSDGIWRDIAPAVFSNIRMLAARISGEFGEAGKDLVMFAENDDYEIAVVALSKTDAVITRRRNRGGGLSHVR